MENYDGDNENTNSFLKEWRREMNENDSDIIKKKRKYKKSRKKTKAEIFSAKPTIWNESFGVVPPGLHLSKERHGYIEYDERMNSSGYFSERKYLRLSDKWVGPSTNFVESTFNAASGGVILVLVLALIFYVFVSFVWTLVFEIDSVNESITERDFSAAFAPLGFIIALITRDWIDGSGKKIIQPLKSLHKYLSTIKTLDKVLFFVYRSKILELHKIMTSEDRIVDSRELKLWIRAVYENVGTNTTLLQGLALHSVRIFKKVDKKIDFERYGITKEEISYFENHLPKKNGQLPGIQSALNLSYMILSRLYSSIFAISSGTTDSMPKMDSIQRKNLSDKLNDLNVSLYEIEQSKDIWEPTLFRYSYASILFVFLGFLLQVDIYSNVDIYTLLVAPLVTILYTLPLIFVYYVGSPFDDYPRWLGPDYDKWRHESYEILKHNESLLFRFLRDTLTLSNKHTVRLILSRKVNKRNYELMSKFISKYHRNTIPHNLAKGILKSILFGTSKYKIVDSKINNKLDELSEINVLELEEGNNRIEEELRKSASIMGNIRNISTLSKISSYIDKYKSLSSDNQKNPSSSILNEIQKSIGKHNSITIDEINKSASTSTSIDSSQEKTQMFATFYRDLIILPEDISFLSMGIIDVRDLKLKRN